MRIVAAVSGDANPSRGRQDLPTDTARAQAVSTPPKTSRWTRFRISAERDNDDHHQNRDRAEGTDATGGWVEFVQPGAFRPASSGPKGISCPMSNLRKTVFYACGHVWASDLVPPAATIFAIRYPSAVTMAAIALCRPRIQVRQSCRCRACTQQDPRPEDVGPGSHLSRKKEFFKLNGFQPMLVIRTVSGDAVSDRRIGLVGCVKRKLSQAAPARDLYVSDLFLARRAFVERTCQRWFILSALHGLVDPRRVLEPYDRTLKDASAAERRAWSALVVQDLKRTLGNLDDVTFEVHAGTEYREFGLRQGLEREQARIEVPAEGLRIGEQLAFYGGQST